MLLANSFLHDTRVYKEARSLIEWGCDVHVIALYDPELPVREEVDGIHVRRISMRRSDLWRLPVVVLSWWCRPILGRAVGSAVGAEPLDLRQDHAAHSAVSAPRAWLPFAGRPTRVARWVGSSSWGPLRRAYRASLKKYRWIRDLVDFVFALRWRIRRTLKGMIRGDYHFVRRLVRTITRPIQVARAVGWSAWGMLRRAYRASLKKYDWARKLVGLVFALRWQLRRGRKRLSAWALNRPTSGRLNRLVPPSLRLLAVNLHLAREAIDLQPDVVQSHDLNTLLGGTLVKRLTGVGLVYDSHELFLKRNIGNKSRARDNVIWAPIERFCIGKCDAVLSVADGICDYLAKQYGISKPHLIRNVQPFEPPCARTTVLADELGVPVGRRIVIYAGAITINRGLEVMIDSAPYLNGSAYVIMGYARNADYLASLKQRATKLGVMSSSVFFREAVPIDDVVRYVASADLGIVPTQNVCLSYFFESSNKIFHCVMAGVPVVMSDHLEKRLLVEAYGIGVLFDETDPKEIARVVNETLDDREAYAVMRRNCLEAARVLNWEHEERNLRQIFADLLGDRAAPIPQVRIEPVCAIETQSPGRPHYATTK